MEQEKIIGELTNLPPEAQKQVFDFIAFLRTKYRKSPSDKLSKTELTNEPFVGIWKDRDDIDSGNWLRKMRKNEWGGQSA